MKEAEPWDMISFLFFVIHFLHICTFINKEVFMGLLHMGKEAPWPQQPRVPTQDRTGM